LAVNNGRLIFDLYFY